MIHRYRSFGLVLVLVALWTSTILLIGGCAPPVAVNGQSTAALTAPGIRALQAKEGIRYLDIIRDTATEAESLHAIPTATAEQVVRWHRALVTTIDKTPQGWAIVALTGLDELQKRLSPADRALLGPYITSARIIYQAVMP